MTAPAPAAAEPPEEWLSALESGVFLTSPLRRVVVCDQVLDQPALHRPTRGVRSVAVPTSAAERAHSLLPALPTDAAFSHVTAAELLALPLSYAMSEDPRVHVTGPLDTRRMRRPGIVAHRTTHRRITTSVQGLPVVAPADTWVDLGELVGRGKPAGLDDLIVIGDAVARALNSIEPLRRALFSRVRPRGKVTLVEALSEIRLGAASPRETATRLMLVRCGLPEPELGQAVIDAAGQFLGVADLFWEEHGVVGEYQGEAFHAGAEQRAADATRRDGFERNGEFIVEEVWNEDLSSSEARRACVLRFADALRIPHHKLDLSRAEARFFSTHTMEIAMQRDLNRWDRRASWLGLGG